MDTGTPRPRRRWLQFSLRSLLVLTAVSAVLIAWLGPRYYVAREQRQAVEAIVASGGQVWYDYSMTGAKEPPAPKWLRRMAGDDFFQRVEGVAFFKPPNLEAADSAALRRLPHLKVLYIYLSASSCDVSLLADLHSLEQLHLIGKGFTDSHLSAISGLTNLQRLTVEATSITDAGLDHLQGLTELRELHIDGNITDAGMLKLKPLTNLTTLKCSRFVVKGNYGRLRGVLDDQTDCEFSDVPVPDVARYFSARHEIPIHIDTSDPNAAMLLDSVWVTDSLTKVTLQAALESLLRRLGLDWTGTPNGLLITTREKAAESRGGLDELRKSLPNLTTVKTDW